MQHSVKVPAGWPTKVRILPPTLWTTNKILNKLIEGSENKKLSDENLKGTSDEFYKHSKT